MISVFSDCPDFFSNAGLKHFIERTGLPVEINQQSGPGIVLSYGAGAGAGTGPATIRMAENEIIGRIGGRVSCTSGRIPVCQAARDTGNGDEVIAFFQEGNLQYPCITRTNHEYFIGIDIFKETGCLLSGHLDTIRDSFDPATKDEVAVVPTVDLLEDLLLTVIRSACTARNLPLVQKSYWPDAKPFAVCLTHDVDELAKTYQWLSRPLRFLARRDLSGFRNQVSSFLQKIRGHEPYYTYDDIIGIEESLGARSTYFILKESGTASIFLKKTWYLYGRNRSLQTPEIQALIRKLLANGDEIGVHGSYFSFADPGLFNRETRELEEVSGVKVVGNRQHNLNMDIPKTWEYHARAGLVYDTSLGFKDMIGFRWGISFPFHPNNGKETLPILEIPLTIMDICLESCHDKEQESLHLADVVMSCHGVLTLLWHPPIFNSLEYPGARELYIRINQYCRDRNAWIARGRDIANWITLRNNLDFSCRYAEKTCTITLHNPEAVCFFTITPPAGAGVTVISGNAEILRQEKDCVFIRTSNLQNDREILVGII